MYYSIFRVVCWAAQVAACKTTQHAVPDVPNISQSKDAQVWVGSGSSGEPDQGGCPPVIATLWYNICRVLFCTGRCLHSGWGGSWRICRADILRVSQIFLSPRGSLTNCASHRSLKNEFRPHDKSRFLIELFSVHTGIAVVALKAACPVTHQALGYCSRTTQSEFCVISSSVAQSRTQEAFPGGRKKSVSYILNYFRSSA